MAGQIWEEADEGGLMYSDELSRRLRTALQPLTVFRQLCQPEDGTDEDANGKTLHAGDKYRWSVYGDIAVQGRRLDERTPMPESGFVIDQAELTIFELGNSVPYTGKLELMALHSLVDIIDKTLRNDARKAFDIESFLEFDRTPLRVSPTGGTSTSSVVLTTNGTPSTTNNVPFGIDHAKAIVDIMLERNIPPYVGNDYLAVSHPTTLRPMKNDLESIHQYTGEGFQKLLNGEVGRYEGVRYLEQNSIPKGGADDSATFDPWTRTADAWNNAQSSWIFFMGADTVAECFVVPEEIRAKIPTDFGRSKAIAWYFIGGYGLVHDAHAQARIIKWDSAT